jgi:hypothetical protein
MEVEILFCGLYFDKLSMTKPQKRLQRTAGKWFIKMPECFASKNITRKPK